MWMGRSNTITKNYVKRKDRFADLFNYYLFQGEVIIKPEDLELIDGDKSDIIEDKNNKERNVQRYRDVTMKWKHGATFTILACENQQKVNYTMPVRSMLYDSLGYVDQIKETIHSSEDKPKNSAEFLSGFKKDDRIEPIITVVLYYGLEEWDGSTDLYGMMEVNDYLKDSSTFREYVPNYKINLIDVEHMDNLEKLHTDLQMMFGVLQYRSNTEKLKEYIKEHKEYFSTMPKDDYRALREFLQSKTILKKSPKGVKREDGKVCVDVCKAIDGIFNNGFNAGVAKSEEKVRKSEEKVRRYAEKARKSEELNHRIINKLSEKMGIAEVAGLLEMEIEEVRNMV